jgi:RNA polymerase sigma-70 factor (ECF subfamily)
MNEGQKRRNFPADQEAFTQVVQSHAGQLTRRASRLSDPHTGQDDAQIAFERAWRTAVDGKFDTTQNTPQVKGWLNTTLGRVAADRRRRSAKEVVGLPATAQSLPSSENIEATVVQTKMVRDALRAVPPGQRAILFRLYFQGHSIKDVAADLGIAEGTVKSQAHRGRETLRKLLEDADFNR